MVMEKEIPTRFDHATEKDIYTKWEKSGIFEPKGEGESFVMTMPPPNVTGDLHMGHALTLAIEDTITRNRRRRGFKTLLLPGADHAGIATQSLVEKKLSKEKGLRRTDLGREKFIDEVWEWINYYMPRNKEYAKRLGVSCDWSRYRFTLDDGYQEAVKVAFVRFYELGLIYQGEYLVNWDPRLQTAVSDEEVIYKETPGKLYYIKYGPITVATTRPETKLGDTAIAVHPDDKKYQQYIDKKIEFTNEQNEQQTLPVIADDEVDPKFGTGAVKVTPSHDPADWAIGKRHDLEFKKVIDENGKMSQNCGPYSGLSPIEAREKIVEDLDKLGLIEKVTDYTVRQPVSERSEAVIEPLPSKQWFLKTTAIAPKAIETINKGQIKFVQKNMEKIALHWLENQHDWCISRQLWWGHRLPVWYRDNETYVGVDNPKGDGWRQEEDVLDTWFSSGLWPFATLGWPKDSVDYGELYPTTLMETGTDILPFWVIRMILMGLTLTEKVPFETVLFHGLVLDEQGKKMSKSRGNVTDPGIMIDKYGADALRMALIGGTASGLSQKFNENIMVKQRNFVTKIWNASRFVAMTCEGAKTTKPENTDETEKEFLEKLENLKKNNQKHHDAYNLHIALEELYEFFWHDFSDKFIEYEKKIIKESDPERATIAKESLLYGLNELLEMLSDFAPFVTTEIKQFTD